MPKEKLSNVTSNLGGGGGGDEYVKICDGGVTGGDRGSKFGDFLCDVIKVWPLSAPSLNIFKHRLDEFWEHLH